MSNPSVVADRSPELGATTNFFETVIGITEFVNHFITKIVFESYLCI